MSSKVFPLEMKTTVSNTSRNDVTRRRRRRPPTQQWALTNTAARQSGCCSDLGACLGFSKTAAPWWAASLLPGDNCISMTRDAWCEEDISRNTRHGAKRLAERRAKQRARLTRIGRRVEVLVTEQRDWYVGKVVPNDLDDAGQKENFVAVKFSNGSVLRNVRPSELRRVPRTTLVYWGLLALIWALGAASVCLNSLAIVHTLHTGPHGEVWLFPDRAFVRLPNTTLYNLTYGEVAAADAHPETWLAAMSNHRAEELHNSTMIHWFRYSQSRILEDCWHYLVIMPAFVTLGAVVELNRVPLSLIITFILCESASIPVGVFSRAITYDWSEKYPGDTLEEVVRRAVPVAVRDTLVFTVLEFAGAMFCGLPHPFFSFLRRHGTARSVSRVWSTSFLVALLYWVVMLLRVFHFTTLLDDVIATDKTLERLAFNIMYLETSEQYLDRNLSLLYPFLIVLVYILLKHAQTYLWRTLISAFFVLEVLLALWMYAVVQPLPLFAPINWQLLYKKLPSTNFAMEVMYASAPVISTFVVFVPALAAIFGAVTTARRVSTLGARARKALDAWIKPPAYKAASTWSSHERLPSSSSAPSTNAMRTVAVTKIALHVKANDYQPLNQRAPSRDVIRPVSSYFENYFARTGTRLRHTVRVPRCLSLLLSTPAQVGRVLAVTGMTLAAYMADVVSGAGAGYRKGLRETLVSVLQDMQCNDTEQEFILDLVDHNHQAHASSSIAKLREVVRRMGTKHRDHIYLRSMEGVGRETGFQQFVDTADQVQAMVVAGLGGQVLRQSVVTESMPWAAGVVRLLDSAYGVRDRYNAFMTTLAVKSGGEFHSAPLKGLFRLSEKLWLRPTNNPDPRKPFFRRGDCANVFDVVRGMIMCTSMNALNICLGLLTSCDMDLWRGLRMERGVTRDEGDATAAQAAGISEELNVLRVKNRFKQPTPSGWADVLINFTFASDPDQHICEVQLVHTGMLTARKHCNAHTAYAKFRSALELLETFGLAPGASTEMEALGAGDMHHREFVQTLEDEYEDFLARYHRMVGIGANTSKDSTGVSVLPDAQPQREVMESLQDLRRELKTLQEERRRDKTELERVQEERRRDKEDYQRQLEEIRSQFVTLTKQT